MSDLKEHRINADATIRYKWMDDTPGGGNLGHAEFVFCPIWKRGVMRELLIYPKQQRVNEFHRLDLSDCGKVTVFSFQVWEHKHIERPWCWRMFWCEEHKTVSYEVYVPKGTNQMSFQPHFGNSIDIHFDSTESRS